MRDKLKSALFYIIAIPIGGVVAFLLYFNGLFALFVPLAIVVIVIVCVVIWKREGKKDKARIEKMYAKGLLYHPTPKPDVIDYDVLPEIAAVISHSDEVVVTAIKECIKDHIEFFKRHRDEYAERDIGSVDEIPRDEFCWDCMVEQLLASRYAVEIDWKTEPEDVLYNLDFIVKKLLLPIDLDDTDFDDALKQSYNASKYDDSDGTWDITRYALYKFSSVLDMKGYALGQIDMDSDSYILFLTESNQREKLVALSNRYGKIISFNFGLVGKI